ncbi:MAG: DUF1934 domain-containing protein [Oscillospiraceae bacterium]|nr:DUF1934 domain-containing protein [Oscillospiraceae bacterium]
MNKEVLITIRSSRKVPGEEIETSEFFTHGTFSRRGNISVVSYNEVAETGLGETKTDLIIHPDRVVVKRRGESSANLTFSDGLRQDFMYNTAFGTMTLGVNTYRVASSLGENGGTMDIEYDLDYQRKHVARNAFHVDVKAKM